MDRPEEIKACLEFLKDYIKPHISSMEVVVLDSSSDSTSNDICKKYNFVRYFHAEPQGSCWAHTSAHYLCEGEYSFYIGDDDRINLNGLIHALDYLNANPNCTAVFAPWTEMFEEKFCDVPHHTVRQTLIKKGDFTALSELITEGTIYPESCLARTKNLHKSILYSPIYKDGFWLKNLISYGDVLYSDKTIYIQGLNQLKSNTINPINGIIEAQQDSFRGVIYGNTRIMLVLFYLLSYPNQKKNNRGVELRNSLLLDILTGRFKTLISYAYISQNLIYLFIFYELHHLLNHFLKDTSLSYSEIENKKENLLFMFTINRIIRYLEATNLKEIIFLGSSDEEIKIINSYFLNRKVKGNIIITNHLPIDHTNCLVIVDTPEIRSCQTFTHFINVHDLRSLFSLNICEKSYKSKLIPNQKVIPC